MNLSDYDVLKLEAQNAIDAWLAAKDGPDKLAAGVRLAKAVPSIFSFADNLLNQFRSFPFVDIANLYKERAQMQGVLNDLILEWQGGRVYAPSDRRNILERALALLPFLPVKLEPTDKRGGECKTGKSPL